MSDKNLDDELKKFSESMNDINNISDMFSTPSTKSDLEDHDTPDEKKQREEYFKNKTLVTEVEDDLLNTLQESDAVLLEELQAHIKAIDELATKYKRQCVAYVSIEKDNHAPGEAYWMFINVGTKWFIKLCIAAFCDLILERFGPSFFVQSLNLCNKMWAKDITESDDE